ncbi:O-antigen ligase family protein [Paenimyroides tangerinum]|uniref:O-antigen ligase family protein n=1 Tax=Paenimyroides tangerinum TaxID=2488728 RepID=A0A3P3W3M2_9FLAO|nr:O-antigen ligase family protein [Paenimyroides tangerinum]RRJ89560.1 O-antigen ligase family protein [Paenimyroides tangerinum]
MLKLKKSNTLLFLLFFSLNFEVWDPLSTNGFFSISKLFGFLYLISIVPHISYFLSVINNFRIYLRLLFIFFTYLTLISFFNINVYDYSFFDFSLFQNIILFFLLSSHEKLKPGVLEKSFFGFYLGSICLAFCYYLNLGLSINSEGRISLFGDNENLVGFRMVISILFLIHFIIKNRLKYFYKILLILSFYPLLDLAINSGSRTAFLSLILSIFLMFFLYKTKKSFIKILGFIFLVIIAFLGINIALNSEVLGERLARTSEESDLSGRDEIWIQIIPQIKENLIFGVGSTGYNEFSHVIFSRFISPHNVFIEILAISGLIGFVLFFYFIFLCFKKAYLFQQKFNELIPFVYIVPMTAVLLSSQLFIFKLGWVILAYCASRSLYIYKK